MSFPKHIQQRINTHAEQAPITALDKSRKLKSLQVTRGKLVSWRKTCKKQIHESTAALTDAENQLSIIDRQIEEIGQNHETIITEHALLRYVERVKGIDLNLIHDEILKLPEEDLVRSGNTIVTVVSDPNDHFNLAERESE